MMIKRKPKILFNTEFTRLSTGYSIYGYELLKALHKMDKYEILELASYARGNDPYHQQLMRESPWKVIPVMPNNEVEQREYDSNPINEFGAYKFDQTCLEHQPDIICSFTDIWMNRFLDDSPFRRLFKTVLMATVDGQPQQDEWLDFYQRTDHVLTYTEYGEKVFKEEGGGTINLRGVASPAVDTNIFKLIPNKKEFKAQNGIDPNSIIIGMVARNQKRKLFPAFAESFSIFLHKLNLEKTENVFLYFHTAHPDMGFLIPYIVKQNGLSHKILFTFFCKNCQFSFPSFYQDVKAFCPRCRQAAASFANSQIGISREQLAKTYGLMDLYVQYANCEGFGIPIVEAAACGLPICATNYSGMESLIQNLGGFPIPVKSLETESETNRKMAIPDGEALAEHIKEFVAMPESMRATLGYKTHLKAINRYGSWDDVAKKWADIFDEIPLSDSNPWRSTIDYVDINMLPPCPTQSQMNDSQFVNWLLTEILHRPDWAGSFTALKMVRDLIYGGTPKGQLGMFSNDASQLGQRPSWQLFDRENLYSYIKNIRNKWNSFELQRHSKIQSGEIK
jgi:glycosyltransferase involved in cell wall biosynthesis